MDRIDERLAHGRAAFLWACGLDVAVRKPGNVSHHSAGHGMEAQAFLASAEASAGPLFARGMPVGERIEAAVAATRAAVGCNTNLGILLLCAPLAAALERLDGAEEAAALRSALHTVLADLDIDDARAAYRAIALANPGGLGRSREQDVAAAPTIDLRAAMTLAADRDSIARQYADGYADVFDCGLAALRVARLTSAGLASGVQSVFLAFLAAWPDTHIVRKLGLGAAQTVTAEAAAWRTRFDGDPAAGESKAFAEWDEGLKTTGINPGTTADLTVCTLFAGALLRPEAISLRVAESWHGS
ncbi:triphosphoribosyl-dephospho-CoA synthase [Azoarcus sp. KH32C]|uniref:triphosphoribosyl-dephospho-CoA synthase n=1 Tax=Azoarcus sp. KH32C TaxID=748247 RepID=UPI0002385DE7|nr:triphosphoribosyl-dephospho-CoA synthase [Azoarcus sp. KH32C]BAL27154.1 triphosphoribosyl-dephospho-CoA protein [Azoarcus sp. KH32C]